METTENINMDSAGSLTLATKGKRVGAYLIDIILASIVGGIIGSFLGSQTMAGQGLSWLISTIYMVLRDALPFTDGMSIGKKVLKIRAVHEDGTHLTNDWAASFTRNILFLIPGLGPLIEIIVFLVNAEGKRLGDGWAKTVVVDEPNA
jgi:uncharacterized RDD family membrane protein YckC